MVLSTWSVTLLYIEVNPSVAMCKRSDDQAYLHPLSQLEKDALVFANEFFPSFLSLLKLYLSVDST